MSPMDVIQQYGGRAYPFNKERLDVLEAEKKAKGEAETLGLILVSDKRNFVIKNGGAQVLVSEIVGKTVGLYFYSYWCRPCRSFTLKLVNVYNKLKDRGEELEIVFLCWDRNQKAFEKYHRSMPWLALPFGDKTRDSVDKLYGRDDIPSFIVVDPNGKEVSNSTDAILDFGSKAYPFTEERLQTLKKEFEEHGKPTDTLDEDQYATDKPSEEGTNAAIDEGSQEDAEAAIDESSKPGGVICDGDVYIAR